MRSAIFTTVLEYIDKLDTPISEDRKVYLNDVIEYMNSKYARNEIPSINFICTHNSRRSQFCQIWATVASNFYKKKAKIYSGGTEATAIYKNVILVLKEIGFEVSSSGNTSNPSWLLKYGSEENQSVECFSKLYNDKSVTVPFAAIMTCSDAETNCPFIPEAESRLSLKYTDPKYSDNSDNWKDVYSETSKNIASEMFYIFSKVNEKA